MKKLLSALIIALTLTSCATILGGKVTACQKEKTAPGTKKSVRPGLFFLDVVTTGFIGLAVDYSTGAIYKPCE